MKENNYTYKGSIGKNDFNSESILLYDPWKDKTLNTSKKKVKNGGTSN